MESIAKLIELFGKSLESLRWWAIAALLVACYLKYGSPNYQPFVGQEYLNADDRREQLGVVAICAAAIFLLGWIANGTSKLFLFWRVKRDIVSERRNRIAERKQRRIEARRSRRAEERLARNRGLRTLRSLSRNQRGMVKAALETPDGILKVTNDAELDLATLLVARNVFARIRPWYNERGGVIGEVFVVNQWVKNLFTPVHNNPVAAKGELDGNGQARQLPKKISG